MTDRSIEVAAHNALGARDFDQLARLFNDEYFYDFGPWDPDQPYGYAPHDRHVICRSGDDIVGHVGWAGRVIGVGDVEVTIAGVGGVLVSERARGQRLGNRLMASAAQSMLDAGGFGFGYLGCREEVVPFYTTCGWRRVYAAEWSIGRDGRPADDAQGQPLMVLPVASELAAWPVGTIDLRGRAW
ncbi:GNAT family N-acetyltransferase [Cryobacterium sp. Y82]|uniref:GNAT family N-acetyltransferase n=1 Tax=Cryobacterium sp. Y82 TaxID=2045017 RepID=UPI000CE4FE1F|nr:GNAT family N-acetyltransferase [Cryobacterium sp. Y82]